MKEEEEEEEEEEKGRASSTWKGSDTGVLPGWVG